MPHSISQYTTKSSNKKPIYHNLQNALLQLQNQTPNEPTPDNQIIHMIHWCVTLMSTKEKDSYLVDILVRELFLELGDDFLEVGSFEPIDLLGLRLLHQHCPSHRLHRDDPNSVTSVRDSGGQWDWNEWELAVKRRRRGAQDRGTRHDWFSHCRVRTEPLAGVGF